MIKHVTFIEIPNKLNRIEKVKLGKNERSNRGVHVSKCKPLIHSVVDLLELDLDLSSFLSCGRHSTKYL